MATFIRQISQLLLQDVENSNLIPLLVSKRGLWCCHLAGSCALLIVVMNKCVLGKMVYWQGWQHYISMEKMLPPSTRLLHAVLCRNLYTIFIVEMLFHVGPAMYFGLMLEYVLFKLCLCVLNSLVLQHANVFVPFGAITVKCPFWCSSIHLVYMLSGSVCFRCFHLYLHGLGFCSKLNGVWEWFIQGRKVAHTSCGCGSFLGSFWAVSDKCRR